MNTVNKPARGAFTNEPVLNRGHPITTSLISSSITKELKLKSKIFISFRNWINVRPKDVFLIILLSKKNLFKSKSSHIHTISQTVPTELSTKYHDRIFT